MSTVISTFTGRTYGVLRVCRVWKMSRSGVYRKSGSDSQAPRRRPGPHGQMPDPELVEEIRKVITASPFHGEGHRKVWARLKREKIYTSKARVLRLMRENGLLAKRCRGPQRGPRAHDGTIIPSRVDEMWGTDMTTILLGTGQQVCVFVAVDHCSASCVGLHAAMRGTRFEALEPVRQGVRKCFGAIGEGVATGLTIRHDNGSQYISRDFQNEIAWLGIASSPSFVRSPEGNGCAERFIRTLKENLLWPDTFWTIEELQQALSDFKDLYNQHWLIERHGQHTPSEFRRGAADEISAAA